MFIKSKHKSIKTWIKQECFKQFTIRTKPQKNNNNNNKNPHQKKKNKPENAGGQEKINLNSQICNSLSQLCSSLKKY